MRRHASAVRTAAILIALADIHAQMATVPSSAEKTAVNALIPWLLQEDAQLRGIPFSEVIFDATGKRVLAFNPKNETDGLVLKQISSALDEVLAQLNMPDSAIQGIPRINEVSSHFEDLMRAFEQSARVWLRFSENRRWGNTTFRLPRPRANRSTIASCLLSRPQTLYSRKPRQFFPHFLFRAQGRN